MALAITGCGGGKSTNHPNIAAASLHAPARPLTHPQPAPSPAPSRSTAKRRVAKPINMSAEPYCQKAHSSPVIPPEVVTGDKGALANVVVYVKDGLGDYTFDDAEGRRRRSTRRAACTTRT